MKLNVPRALMLMAGLAAIAAALAALTAASAPDSFRFAILGDRTGDAQPGVFEEACREAAAAHPSFVLGTGDLIEGRNDATADYEWEQWERIRFALLPLPLYVAAGNHDIWSKRSDRLFRQYVHREPRYSFDYGAAHFTVLDTSRSAQLSPDDLAFLHEDLAAHAAQPLKFIVSHRPFWRKDVKLPNPHFDFQEIALNYQVRYVISGHIHRLQRFPINGVTYVSMESSGGRLQGTNEYRDGWFFGITIVDVHGKEATVTVKELSAPYGHARVTSLDEWGPTGLPGGAR